MRQYLQAAFRLKYKYLRKWDLSQAPILGALRKIVLALMKSDVVHVQGHRMALDPLDSLQLAATGVFEPYESELAVEHARPGGAVIDLGANIGYYTLLLARKVGPDGMVFAFEPDPANFNILEQNVAMNGYRNVDLIRKAASDRPGSANLYVCDANAGDHRLYDSGDGRPSFEVETVRLDDFFAGNDRPIDLIKMDIQGAEFLASKGMAGILRRNRGIKVITEFWPYGLEKSGCSPRETLEFFATLGFDLFEINERERRLDKRAGLDWLRDARFQNQGFANLLCVRPL